MMVIRLVYVHPLAFVYFKDIPVFLDPIEGEKYNFFEFTVTDNVSHQYRWIAL